MSQMQKVANSSGTATSTNTTMSTTTTTTTTTGTTCSSSRSLSKIVRFRMENDRIVRAGEPSLCGDDIVEEAAAAAVDSDLDAQEEVKDEHHGDDSSCRNLTATSRSKHITPKPSRSRPAKQQQQRATSAASKTTSTSTSTTKLQKTKQKGDWLSTSSHHQSNTASQQPKSTGRSPDATTRRSKHNPPKPSRSRPAKQQHHQATSTVPKTTTTITTTKLKKKTKQKGDLLSTSSDHQHSRTSQPKQRGVLRKNSSLSDLNRNNEKESSNNGSGSMDRKQQKQQQHQSVGSISIDTQCTSTEKQETLNHPPPPPPSPRSSSPTRAKGQLQQLPSCGNVPIDLMVEQEHDDTVDGTSSSSNTNNQRGVLRLNSSLSDLEDMVESRRPNNNDATLAGKREPKGKASSHNRLMMHMSLGKNNLVPSLLLSSQHGDDNVNPEPKNSSARKLLSDNYNYMVNSNNSNNNTSITPSMSSSLIRLVHSAHDKQQTTRTALSKQNSFARAVKSDHLPVGNRTAAITTAGIVVGCDRRDANQDHHHKPRDDMSKSNHTSRSSRYANRLRMHQSLSQLRSDYDDIGKLALYKNKNTHNNNPQKQSSPERRRPVPVLRRSSSLSDLGLSADRASKRSLTGNMRINSRQSCAKHQNQDGSKKLGNNTGHASVMGTADGSDGSIDLVHDQVEEVKQTTNDRRRIHRDISTRRMHNSGYSKKSDDSENIGGTVHGPPKQSHDGKFSQTTTKTSKGTQSQNTGATMAKSTTARQNTEKQREEGSRRQALRKNSSSSDLQVMAQEVGGQGTSGKPQQNSTMYMYKSLSHIKVEPKMEGETKKLHRGRSKSKRCRRDGRRSSSDHVEVVDDDDDSKDNASRKDSALETDDTREGRKGAPILKPSRSRSKSQRKRSVSKNKRGSDHARSRSRHRRYDIHEGEDEGDNQIEGTKSDGDIPEHVFVDRQDVALLLQGKVSAGEGEDDASFSSLEGPSVILDRRTEARKKAKKKRASISSTDEPNASGDFQNNTSSSSLDLLRSDELGSKAQSDRLNKSMGDIHSNSERKTQAKRSKSKGSGVLNPSEKHNESLEVLATSPIQTSSNVAASQRTGSPLKPTMATKNWKLDDSPGIFRNRMLDLYDSVGSLEFSPQVSHHPDERLHNSLDFSLWGNRRTTTSTLETDITVNSHLSPESFVDGDDENEKVAPEAKPAPKWLNRLSTHAILADHTTEIISPEKKPDARTEKIRTNSRKLFRRLTEEQRKLDPKEQFWSVLTASFQPLGDDA